jgi:outer membrane protease
MTQRDKDKFKQSYYTFDHVFHQDTTNLTFYNECIAKNVRKTLAEPDSSLLFLGFGHKEAGKSYSIMGNNNSQNISLKVPSVPIS